MKLFVQAAPRAQSVIALLVALLCGAAYFALVRPAYDRPRPAVTPEMEVALPRFAQVAMAAGDRYLAANAGTIRTLVAVNDKMDAENFRIQGIVQSDVAWLNPAQEDNYYVAAAILPWSGQLEAAQYILRRATEARPFDYQPAFFYGFNEMHFRRDTASAVQWLHRAATHTPDQEMQIYLMQIATNWASRGGDPSAGARMVRAMSKSARNKPFAEFLEKRAMRLDNQVILDDAVSRYRERFGMAPPQLGDVVARGVIAAIPVDPFGDAYVIGAQGRVVAQQVTSGAARKASK